MKMLFFSGIIEKEKKKKRLVQFILFLFQANRKMKLANSVCLVKQFPPKKFMEY